MCCVEGSSFDLFVGGLVMLSRLLNVILHRKEVVYLHVLWRPSKWRVQEIIYEAILWITTNVIPDSRLSHGINSGQVGLTVKPYPTSCVWKYGREQLSDWRQVTDLGLHWWEYPSDGWVSLGPHRNLMDSRACPSYDVACSVNSGQTRTESD